MQAPLKDKDDIKIFILYLLRNIKYPLEFSTINDIVVQDEIVNCFDFAECFAELLEAGNIEENKTESGLKYHITEQGIHVSDNLYGGLLRSIRDRGLRSAYRLLTFRDRDAKTMSEITETADGSFVFECGISESGKDVLTLKIAVTDKKRVQQMKYYFDEFTEEVYADVLSVLSGDNKF